MISLGPKLGLMDEPGERRVHVKAVPRAGGLAIWIGSTAIVWLVDTMLPALFVNRHQDLIVSWTASSALLIAVGFLDDWKGLNAWVKLLGQAISAGVFCVLYYPEGFSLAGIDFSFISALIIFVGWSVGVMNAFNLIDGLDGLCGGLVVVSLTMVLILVWSAGNWRDSVFIVIMLGMVAGFLVYNINPARIFLGDAGSMMLGFFIAAAADNMVGEKAIVGVLLLPIAVAGVPLLDVLLAIWRRTSRRQFQKSTGQASQGGVFTADKDHLHHRLLAMGLTQRKVAFILQGFSVVIAALCLLPMIAGGRAVVVTIFGFIVIGLFAVRHFARIELAEAGDLMHLKIRTRSLSLSHRGIHFVYDVVALVTACFVAMVVETNFGLRVDATHIWSVNYLIVFVIIGLALLKVADTYQRVWSRPTFVDFFTVGVFLSMSGLLTSLIWSLNKSDVSWSDYRTGILAGQFALWLVLIPRGFPVMLREFTLRANAKRSVDAYSMDRRVLIYGAGALGGQLLDFVKVGGSREIATYQILGFLDEHRSFRGRLFRGFRVFGGIDQLEELSKKHGLEGIVVTISELSDEQRERLVEVTKSLDLNLYRWGVEKEFHQL